jgi:acetyl esterase/lipase
VEAPELSPYLAPAFLAVAQYDVLRDEGIDFGRRLTGGRPDPAARVGGSFPRVGQTRPRSALTRSFRADHLHATTT